MKLSTTKKAVLALIIANTIWGAASPIFKWALLDIQPFSLAFLRFFFAAYLLLFFTAKNLSIKRKDIPLLIAGTFFGVTVNISFFFLALPLTASINAPIIASAGPIILVFASVIFLHEKLRSKVIKGMILSLIGVLIVIFRPTGVDGVNASIIGNIFLVIATFGSVVDTLIMKKLAPSYSPLTLMFWQFLIGSMTFLPLMLSEITQKGFLINLDIRGITGILFGVFLSSALAYTLYQYALKYMYASETGVFTYIDPIIAVIIAIPLLSEKLTPAYLIGAILVFLGIYIAENRIHYHPLQLLTRMSEGLKSII
jgi:drug/metabolite transporter (DMT)-like permease